MILLVSQGVPMILAGDEARRTQRGNNNPWCQDNEVSWFDWARVEANAPLLAFWRELISFRKRHRALRRTTLLRRRAGRRWAPSRCDLARLRARRARLVRSRLACALVHPRRLRGMSQTST